ncbi:hypothetical protein NC653_010182 [Populus alba x Populus x berolinensis]|uniref:Uncharacterized protein n=1 Tax=Populus alba x Populus x berolinensis TaxID=444605 RepID=A0AAD6W5F8_9ROSI|nr:hypothetical protein NC653_010182 [Populus alba x Populus x berolinensis]
MSRSVLIFPFFRSILFCLLCSSCVCSFLLQQVAGLAVLKRRAVRRQRWLADDGDRSRREPICGFVVPLGEELELLWRYHRRRPVCGSGDDGDDSVGAAAVATAGQFWRWVCGRRVSAATGGISGVDGEEEIGEDREAAALSVLLRRCWWPSAEGEEDAVDGLEERRKWSGGGGECCPGAAVRPPLGEGAGSAETPLVCPNDGRLETMEIMAERERSFRCSPVCLAKPREKISGRLTGLRGKDEGFVVLR